MLQAVICFKQSYADKTFMKWERRKNINLSAGVISPPHSSQSALAVHTTSPFELVFRELQNLGYNLKYLHFLGFSGIDITQDQFFHEAAVIPQTKHFNMVLVFDSKLPHRL